MLDFFAKHPYLGWTLAVVLFVDRFFPELPFLLLDIAWIFIKSDQNTPQRAIDVPLPKDIAALSASAVQSRASLEDEEQDPLTKPLRRMKGWVEVRRQYASSKGLFNTAPAPNFAGATPIGQKATGSIGSNASGGALPPGGFASDDASMNVLVGGDDDSQSMMMDDGASTISAAPSVATQSTTNTSSSSTAATKSIWQTTRLAMLWKNSTTPSEKFYAVLKGSVLYLYQDDKQTDALYVLPIDRYRVKIETKDGRFGGKDGEMFNKKNAIILQLDREQHEDTAGMSVVGKDTSVDEAGRKREAEMEYEPWFIFSRNHSEMEDWYLAIAQESLNKAEYQEAFGLVDMSNLVKQINMEEDPVPTRWLNALLGRAFFGLNNTAFLEAVITDRIMKKIKKLPSHKFVKDIAVREFNLGTFPPMYAPLFAEYSNVQSGSLLTLPIRFSKPMLKDVREDGYTACHAHLNYRAQGNQANSAAHVTFVALIQGLPGLGDRGTIAVTASAVVKHIEGDMLFQIKAAPSNRLWYGFTSPPTIDFDLILYPIGGERRISSTWVINKLKSYIVGAIAEAIVAPNFDDLAFFDTRGMEMRGGIFNEASKAHAQRKKQEAQAAADSAETTQPTSTLPGAGAAATVPTTEAPAKAKSFHTSIPAGSDGGSGVDSPPRKRSRSPKKQAATLLSSVPLPIWPVKQATTSSTASAPAASALHKSATESILVSEPSSLHATDNEGRGRSGAETTTGVRDSSTGSAPPSSTQPQPRAGLKGPIRPSSIHSGSDPVTSAPTRTSPTGSLLSTFTRPKSTDTTRSNETVQTDRAMSPNGSARTATPPADQQAQTNVPTASTIFGSLKARDKEALSGHVSNVRGALSSWSNKKKAEYQQYQASRAEAAAKLHPPAASSSSPSAGTQPMPMYRPSSRDRDSHPHALAPSSPPTASRSSLGHSPAKSLQERLNDVSRAAAAANAENRARSTSNASSTNSGSTSRHALLSSSPTKGGLVQAAPSTSEPELVLAHQRTPPNGTTKTPSPGPNPVLLQPAAGRSMVVPRVPKRPGQVTGLGSSPGLGVTRKLSDADTDPSPPSEKETAAPPSLPPRHSEPALPPPDLPSRPAATTSTSVPPPLPARHTDHDSRDDVTERIPRTPSPDESTIHEAEIGTPEDPAIAELPGDSDAQTALRKLAEQDVEFK